MTDDDTLHVQQLVHQLGGVAYAQQLATKYTEQALKDIRKLPDNYFGTKEKLERLTSQILTRKANKNPSCSLNVSSDFPILLDQNSCQSPK